MQLYAIICIYNIQYIYFTLLSANASSIIPVPAPCAVLNWVSPA